MPRNSSGNYTLPAGNPVAPNTLIETAWANPTMADIGAELTNSLDRNGRGTMLAPLKIADGTVGAPALSFNSEASSGFYKPATHVIALAIAGAQIAAYSDTGITFKQPVVMEQDLTVDGAVTLNGAVDITGATTLKLADGTLPLPSLAFDTDPDTGLYLPGADIVGMVAGGVEAARWRSTGLSVMSDKTGAALIVDRLGTSAALPALFAGTVAVFTGASSAASAAYISLISGNAAIGGIHFGDTDSDNRGFLRYSHATNTLFLGTQGINQMTIDANGMVNTTAPSVATAGVYSLKVNANATSLLGVFVTAAGAAGSGRLTPTTTYFRVEARDEADANYAPMQLRSSVLSLAILGNEALHIDSSRRVLIGDDVAYNVNGMTANKFQVHSTGGDSGFSLSTWAASATGGDIQALKSRGAAIGTRGVVVAGDVLLQIVAAGDDGTNFIPAARIDFQVDSATPGPNDMPGRIVFYTTLNGDSSVTEAMRISNSRQVTIAAPPAGVESLVVNFASGGTEVAQVWGDGTRTAVLRTTSNQLSFGAQTSTVLNLLTNNAVRIAIANATVDFTQGSGCLRIGGDITRYESGEITCPNAAFTNVNAAHGGPRKPDLFSVTLRCKVAEQGYSINDEVDMLSDIDGSASAAVQGWSSATNVGALFTRTVANPPAIRNKTTGALATVTVANWRVVLRAIWL